MVAVVVDVMVVLMAEEKMVVEMKVVDLKMEMVMVTHPSNQNQETQLHRFQSPH